MYLNTLTKINNALRRGHERVKVPYSGLDFSVVESLAKYGYVDSVSKKGKGAKRIIEIKLKYKDGEPAILGLKFFSRSSRRVYVGYRDMKKSRDGYGYYFFSTPKGIMTNIEARKSKVGGEMLFEIW
ncbi:MAG: 30S ribosomal protein S8 [Candidatus Colwellbacteria bacterium RIFCSPLOWO2_01_FULL_48_10]|uniref:Small ribosomal subunit protein uS8 n=1 Tax=Candidatus Colwellbacteria bacterium RIFCSPLOWO2_01_FULL_48_10 TaxID=1797690 RepID=A0A1G1Z6M5_9BACT|nr:MAG: 30S ribosomal protein S8 [Candidatus Colwellbacteria bacterium RIFCSPLOWO2_01_FULL_48_10]